MPKIHKVGVELEGAWHRRPSDSTIKHDGSVTARGDYGSGEVVSSPCSPDEAYVWMKNNYPDVVNDSCGLHVHFSFRSELDYARLMDKEFETYFIEEMTEWGKRENIPRANRFWYRLDGNEDYCKKEWMPDIQVSGGHSRYTQWNFQARGKFGTTECRVLPCFPAKAMSVSAVQQLVKIVEDYLAQCPRPRQISLKIAVPVLLEDGPIERIL